MKATITIKGQISSTLDLSRAIPGGSVRHFMLITTDIEFPTLKDAVKALSEGYKYLKRNNDTDTPLSYSRGNFLRWDAATAHITTN